MEHFFVMELRQGKAGGYYVAKCRGCGKFLAKDRIIEKLEESTDAPCEGAS